MPSDITACATQDCPQREICHRAHIYDADQSNEHQEANEWLPGPSGECRGFVPSGWCPKERPAQGRVGGVLRGGHVVGNVFRFHTPAPVSVPLDQVKELELHG